MGAFRMAALVTAGAIAIGTAQAQDAKAFGPTNPFFAASPLPFQAPPFDRIHDADYEPALLAGMAQQEAEIRAITENPAAPTFDNTILAMEKSGELLHRVSAAMGGVAGAYTNPDHREDSAEHGTEERRAS